MISSTVGGSAGYRKPLFAGERPAWNPGFVAGERRRPARSSNGSDMTPPRARRDEPELALRHRSGTSTNSRRTLGLASKEHSPEPTATLLALLLRSGATVCERPVRPVAAHCADGVAVHPG